MFHQRIAFLILLLALPELACAHLGSNTGLHQGLGFQAGFIHPFSGADHLCAMLIVGLWSALTLKGGRAWASPLAFAAMLMVGAVLGMNGVVLASVEPMIAASVLILGLLLAVRVHLAAAAAALLCGGFALFHGLAHGTELAGANSPTAALTGMILGTVSLHLIGMALGRVLATRSVWWPRALGASAASLGALMLAHLA